VVQNEAIADIWGRSAGRPPAGPVDL